MRRACNHHLAGACRWWAVCATQRDPGAQAFYQRRRDAGDGYEAALRRLAAKLIGQLHYCLTHRCHCDPARAGTSPAVTSRPPGCLSTAGHRTATVRAGTGTPAAVASSSLAEPWRNWPPAGRSGTRSWLRWVHPFAG
jgi:hypothetical protein